MSSPLAGVAVINAIVFGVYGNIQKNQTESESLKSHFLSGAAAGNLGQIFSDEQTYPSLSCFICVVLFFRSRAKFYLQSDGTG